MLTGPGRRKSRRHTCSAPRLIPRVALLAKYRVAVSAITFDPSLMWEVSVENR